MSLKQKAVVVLGAQWGDEGKGKLVDLLAPGFTVVARCQGGANAGHTVIHGDKKFALHLFPSGIVSGADVVLGPGVVISLTSFLKEFDALKQSGLECRKDKIFVSGRSHVVLDFHKEVDASRERCTSTSLGTTKQGIGPCWESKVRRNGLRICDLYSPHFEKNFRKLATSFKDEIPNYDFEQELKTLKEIILPKFIDSVTVIRDTSLFFSKVLQNDAQKLLIEGANATLLDIDHGTYPCVTSSSCSVGGCLTGLGVSISSIGEVIGVFKAYVTRVGAGPFPTEITDENLAKIIQINGHEVGTTTGRSRKVGWLDIPALLYAIRINGFTSLNMAKLDILSLLEEVKIGVKYQDCDYFPDTIEELENVHIVYETFPGWMTDISECKTFDSLPPNCQKFVQRVQELVKVPIHWIGTGRDTQSIIELH